MTRLFGVFVRSFFRTNYVVVEDDDSESLNFAPFLCHFLTATLCNLALFGRLYWYIFLLSAVASYFYVVQMNPKSPKLAYQLQVHLRVFFYVFFFSERYILCLDDRRQGGSADVAGKFCDIKAE